MKIINTTLLISSICSLNFAQAIVIRHDVSESLYDNLALGYGSAVWIDIPGTSGSGTLISPTQILTAAHVVDSDIDGIFDGALTGYEISFGLDVRENNVSTADFKVGGNSGGIIAIDVNPFWNTSSGSRVYDLAVITLSSAITGYIPYNISAQSTSNIVGTMVGYGGSGFGNSNDLIYGEHKRRAAQNELFINGDGTLQSDFDNPNGSITYNGSSTPVALEGSTAGGDSGGAVFADFGNGDEIVGVLSGGRDTTSGDGYYGDVSIWAPINNADNLNFLSGLGITPVPEPSSSLLIVFGSSMFLFKRNRK